MKSSVAEISLRTPASSAGYWLDLLVSRALPAAFFALFVGDKLLFAAASVAAIVHHPSNAGAGAYMFALNQVLSGIYFSLLTVMFATRRTRAGGRRDVWTVIVTFFGTFAILLTALLPQEAPRQSLVLTANILLSAGLAYSIWSLLYLGRSLSLLPEARHLVTGGPYRLSRHPLYLGEGMAALGTVIPTVAWPGAVLMALFLAAQWIRMNWEEEILARHFPSEYAAYRRRVSKYLPFPRRLLPSKGA